MQRSAGLPSGSPSTRVRPASTSTRWNDDGPSPGETPVQSEVYGFIRSPVAERGRSCIRTPRSRHSSTTFSTPITVTSVSGSVVHIRPFPSDSTTRDRSGLRDREVRAGDGDAGAEERLAEVLPRGREQRLRVVGEPRLPERLAEQLGDLGTAAVERRDERVRRPLARQLDDPLGEIRLDRLESRLRERVVEPELVGREGLHLHDLARAAARDEADDDLVRLGGVACPVHLAPRAR